MPRATASTSRGQGMCSGALGSNTFKPHQELPTSPTVTKRSWSQHGKSWMAATTAWERSQLPGPAQSSVCPKLILSVVTCPYLHSGCPYSRAHTLDSCTPPGCCIPQSGSTPGQGSSSTFTHNRSSCFSAFLPCLKTKAQPSVACTHKCPIAWLTYLPAEFHPTNSH